MHLRTQADRRLGYFFLLRTGVGLAKGVEQSSCGDVGVDLRGDEAFVAE